MAHKPVIIIAPRCPECGGWPLVHFDPDKGKVALTCSECAHHYERNVGEFVPLVEGPTKKELAVQLSKASRARSVKDKRHTKKVKIEEAVVLLSSSSDSECEAEEADISTPPSDKRPASGPSVEEVD